MLLSALPLQALTVARDLWALGTAEAEHGAGSRTPRGRLPTHWRVLPARQRGPRVGIRERFSKSSRRWQSLSQ